MIDLNRRWRIDLTFDGIVIHTVEHAAHEHTALAAALRYAAALGYSGQPTRITSRRIA